VGNYNVLIYTPLLFLPVSQNKKKGPGDIFFYEGGNTKKSKGGPKNLIAALHNNFYTLWFPRSVYLSGGKFYSTNTSPKILGGPKKPPPLKKKRGF